MSGSYLDALLNPSAPFPVPVPKEPTVHTIDRSKVKVVINREYGGFCLSKFALGALKKKGYNVNRDGKEIPRDAPELIRLMETHGSEKISGDIYGIPMQLEVVEIEDGKTWRISEYDGLESVIVEK